MTLQQLRYVTTIANIGSISEAAKRLFVSQPSLTKAIKELEKEMGITIFDRTNKGITVSKEGERFLGKTIFHIYTTLLLCCKCFHRSYQSKRCRLL